MKTTALFIYLTLVLVSFYGCKDDNEPCNDENTNKIHQHALDYFYFKKGSYWVYQEQNSGEIDSVWVEKDIYRATKGSNASNRNCKCGYGICTQEAHMILYSSKENDTNTYSISINSDVGADRTDVREHFSASKKYFLASSERAFYRNYALQRETQYGGIYSDMDTVTVNGITYKDILHYNYPKPTRADWLAEGWYAKNIYLVKYRTSFDSTNTWNLVRYNIVK